MPWTGPIPLRGRDGAPGLAGEQGDDAPLVPGQAGATGLTGGTGLAGPMGMPGMAGDDGADGPLILPQIRGANGVTTPAPGMIGLGDITPASVTATGASGVVMSTGAHGWVEAFTLEKDYNAGAGIAGDGVALGLRASDSAAPGTIMGYLRATWAVATAGATRPLVEVLAVDAVATASGIGVGMDGAGHALVGFFGVAPVARQSGDVAAALLLSGLMSAATYSAAKLTGVMAPSVVGSIPATGPSPEGSSDDQVYMPPPSPAVQSGAVAAAQVVTDESTASAVMVDLATGDTVTFVLDVARTVVVMYFCNVYSSAPLGVTYNEIMYDGVLDANTTVGFLQPAANSQTAAHCLGIKALGAGSHTVKVQHSAAGGTGHWLSRTLAVLLLP